jgi:Holliday junction DNA helicase RuvA
VIALLSGLLAEKKPGQVIVNVHGVGYRVMVSLNTFYELPAMGAEIVLHIQTVVREEAIHLYGFSQSQEKETFLRLIGVNGVGPKLALTLLSGMAPEELWQAVRAGDGGRLHRVPGVGKKIAARLLVELEGKIPQGSGEGPAYSNLEADVLSALLNLGYAEAQARKALDEAALVLGVEPGLQELLKTALKYAAGGRN